MFDRTNTTNQRLMLLLAYVLIASFSPEWLISIVLFEITSSRRQNQEAPDLEENPVFSSPEEEKNRIKPDELETEFYANLTITQYPTLLPAPNPLTSDLDSYYEEKKGSMPNGSSSNPSMDGHMLGIQINSLPLEEKLHYYDLLHILTMELTISGYRRQLDMVMSNDSFQAAPLPEMPSYSYLYNLALASENKNQPETIKLSTMAIYHEKFNALVTESQGIPEEMQDPILFSLMKEPLYHPSCPQQNMDYTTLYKMREKKRHNNGSTPTNQRAFPINRI